MNKNHGSPWLWLLTLLAVSYQATAADPAASLLGTWRLIGIDYSGPNGPLPDPVFGPNPSGIIIYDRSGWMSVQIVTAGRPALVRPASRTSGSRTPEVAMQKAQAFDSYYAYCGTWTYDLATQTITHHLQSSLLPYETGLDYRRHVSLRGDHLELSVSDPQKGGEVRTRTLAWERVLGSAMPP